MASKIYNDNVLDAATRTVSSEDTYFPADNLYDGNARSKVWRSTGQFIVTSANQDIVFEETASTPLTATITAGTYTSVSAFLTAIKTALDAAGASTYTVTQETSKKIKIESDGGGGGGIFNLLWTNAGTNAADLLGFDDSADDTGSLIYTADNIRIHTEESLTWDLGTSKNPEFFAMAGRRNDGLQISSTGTYKLQANPTNVWTSPSWEETLTYNETLMYLEDSTGIFDAPYRYVRLSIVDKDNAAGVVELSSVFLGDAISFTQGVVVTPLAGSYADGSTTRTGPNLNLLSVSRETSEQFTFSWNFLTNTEKEALDDFFRNYKTARPFWVNIDTNAAMSTTSGYYIRLVKMLSPPSWRRERELFFSMQMPVQEDV